MGIEPTLAAWEAAVLPLNYTRASRDSIKVIDVQATQGPRRYVAVLPAVSQTGAHTGPATRARAQRRGGVSQAARGGRRPRARGRPRGRGGARGAPARATGGGGRGRRAAGPPGPGPARRRRSLPPVARAGAGPGGRAARAA